MNAPAAPAPAAAPSAPAPSAPSSTPSSTPSSAKSTTADFAQRLSDGNLNSSGPSQDSPGSDQVGEFSEQPDASVDNPAAEQQWYDRYAEGVHGVPVQELLQALEEGRLPEALYDKLRFELQDGEDVWEDTVGGLKSAAQMRANFTRKTQALSEERKAFHGERDEFVQYLRNWKDSPEQLLHGLERLQLPVLDAAKLLSERLVYAERLNHAVPGSGDQWLDSIRAQSELHDLRRAQERQQQQVQQKSSQERTAKTQAAVQNASREVFKEVGLNLEKSSWDLYSQHVQAILDDNGGKNLTRNHLREAARRTKQQVDSYVRTYAANQGKPKDVPGSKLAGDRLDAGRNAGVPDRAPKKGTEKKTTEQFFQEMQNLQRNRR